MNEFNPREFRRSLRGPDISDAEYRVAVELAEFSMIGKPTVWPSVPTLAENCGMDDRSVRRILGRLEAKGVIVCAVRSKGGRGQTSRWQLCANKTLTRESGFTGHKTLTHEAENPDPAGIKTLTHRSPEVVIEEERRRGDAPPAWGGNASPGNDDDVSHPETWAEWAAKAELPVERPFCPRHPRGNTGQPCGGCKEARELLEQWKQEHADWQELTKELRAEIRACKFCDELGQYTDDEGLWWCEHDVAPPGYVPNGPVDCPECFDSGNVYRARKWDDLSSQWIDCHADDDGAKRLLVRCTCKTSPAGVYRCNTCQDRGIVLNSDGKPGSKIRICHHDGSWHIATLEELADLEVA
jgi:hypothetical protein